MATSTEVATIPDHPPVTTSGVVAKFDPTTRVLIFQDGRTVKLTDQSQVLQPKVLQPVDLGSIKSGDRVVVQNAMPVAVKSASKSGKRQRMATVASVDQQTQIVRMTDGSAVRVTPSTNLHRGLDGPAVVLADLQPGDELVIIMMDETTPTTGASATTGAQATTGTRPEEASALPGRVVTGAPSDPSDASELMVFREVQAP